MNNKLIFLLLYFLGISLGLSQSTNLSDYSFVVIPKQFEFQLEENQYQLNELLKNSLANNGFNAYYLENLPDTKRCDGLFLEATGSPGFIWTKIQLIFKDCNGFVVYRSAEGKSKLKEYDKAYLQATGLAFQDVKELQVSQKEIRPITYDTEKEIAEKENFIKVNGKDNVNLPEEKYVNYKLNNATFLLRKTDSGYSLYQETDQAQNGLLLLGQLIVENNEVWFLDPNEKKYPASFDVYHNLTIFKTNTILKYTKD